MDKPNLKKLFQATRSGASAEGQVRVLVALNTKSATTECLERLAGLGLQADKVIGNTVTGAIASSAIDALRRDPNVREVERARTLRPHDDP